jgi:hypothetical protein
MTIFPRPTHDPAVTALAEVSRSAFEHDDLYSQSSGCLADFARDEVETGSVDAFAPAERYTAALGVILQPSYAGSVLSDGF